MMRNIYPAISRNRFVFSLLLMMLGPAAVAFSQNMNMPYSIYGIGDMDFRAYNRTNGMASTGLALQSSFYLIDNNPAGLAGLTRSFYLIHAGAAARSVHYSGDPINADNSNNKDFWIKRLSLSVKINNWWASSLGFNPFSSVNYSYVGSTPVQGSNATYLTTYQGDGGLNEFYWTNAFAIGKRLSIGLRSSIITGSINHYETVTDPSLITPLSTQIQEYYGKPRLQAGFIYDQPFSKKWDVSIGGRFSPKTNIITERTLTVSDGTSSLVSNDYLKSGNFYLPDSYGAGIAIKHNQKMTYALDYTYEDWSSLLVKQQGWQLVSSNRLSAGVEVSRKATLWKQEVEKRFFQFGGYINNSYLQVRNQPINEFGFTAGMGGFIGQGLLYSLSLEAGKRGTTQDKLIRENFVQATVTFSYRDFLMSKGRKYD